MASDKAEVELPRSDFYVYILFRHDTAQPFYVGKGRGDRWLRHLNTNRCGDTNKHKKAIIRLAADAGREVPIVKVAEDLTEQQAFDLERSLIATLGRAQFGGILSNLTDGGDGEAGRIFSDEHRAKLRAAKLGGKRSEEAKAKLRITMALPEVRAKIGAAQRRRFEENPEARERCGSSIRGKKWPKEKLHEFASYGHLGIVHSAEIRAKISEKLKGKPWSANRRLAHDKMMQNKRNSIGEKE